jgi:hypothetical protein
VLSQEAAKENFLREHRVLTRQERPISTFRQSYGADATRSGTPCKADFHSANLPRIWARSAITVQNNSVQQSRQSIFRKRSQHPCASRFFDPGTEAAANALLDLVFQDVAAGDFDSDPTLTNGCSFAQCSVFIPFAVDTAASLVIVSGD